MVRVKRSLAPLTHSYPLFPALTLSYPLLPALTRSYLLLPALPSSSQTDLFWHVLIHCCFHSCLLSIWYKTKMLLPLKWPWTLVKYTNDHKCVPWCSECLENVFFRKGKPSFAESRKSKGPFKGHCKAQWRTMAGHGPCGGQLLCP